MAVQPSWFPVLGTAVGWMHSWSLAQTLLLVGVLGRSAANAPAGLPKVPAPIRVMPATPTTDPARRAANALVARLEVVGSPGRRTSLLIGVRIWGTSNSRGMTYGTKRSERIKTFTREGHIGRDAGASAVCSGFRTNAKRQRPIPAALLCWFCNGGAHGTAIRIGSAVASGKKRRAPVAAPFSPTS